MGPRFLTLDQVAEELATSRAQAYALVRSRELPAIKLGGRGQWRVERTELELYIQRRYTDTARFVLEHPWPGERDPEEDDDDVASDGSD